MAMSHDDLMDVLCRAMELKEKKRALYEEALKACTDEVGQETYRILRDAESRHSVQIQETHDELKQGRDWADACRFLPPDDIGMQVALEKISIERGKATSVCADDISVLETGIQLEEASIRFFEDKLKATQNPAAREFLEQMAIDERQHRALLADLKFYYADPEAWFMEKSKARLDGAGGVT